jgi:E3 ubiquitin-protein ligase HUWE1
VNLADKYSALAKSLGLLHAACVWEEILLQKDMPEAWNEATRVPGFGMGGEEGRGPISFLNPDEASETGDAGYELTAPADDDVPQVSNGDPRAQNRLPRGSVPNTEKGAAFKNVKILRYLLSSLPSSITGFFHLLGHGLISKRRMDTYQRQKASMVADAIASTILEQLNLEAPRTTPCLQDRFSYLIVILSSFQQLLFDSKFPITGCILVSL